MTASEVIARLRRMANPRNVAGMARYGIATTGTLGITIYDLRRLAREIGVDHRLAGRLWASGIHEARILAGFIEDPARVTDAQMERWVRDFDSWDVCDQVTEVFVRTPAARRKIRQWAAREEEFVKRAAFAMIAEVAAHDRAAPDGAFEPFFRLIRSDASDDRNYVKKAVSWALRNIGKRSRALNRRAVAVARELAAAPSRGARWVAADVLRELTDPAVRARLRARPRAPAGRPRRPRTTPRIRRTPSRRVRSA